MGFRSLLFVPLKATNAPGKMHGARDSCIIACGAVAEENWVGSWEIMYGLLELTQTSTCIKYTWV